MFSNASRHSPSSNRLRKESGHGKYNRLRRTTSRQKRRYAGSDRRWPDRKLRGSNRFRYDYRKQRRSGVRSINRVWYDHRKSRWCNEQHNGRVWRPENLATGGKAFATTVSSGGTLNAPNNAVVSGLTVQSGGRLYLPSGGGEVLSGSINVASGAQIELSGSGWHVA